MRRSRQGRCIVTSSPPGGGWDTVAWTEPCREGPRAPVWSLCPRGGGRSGMVHPLPGESGPPQPRVTTSPASTGPPRSRSSPRPTPRRHHVSRSASPCRCGGVAGNDPSGRGWGSARSEEPYLADPWHRASWQCLLEPPPRRFPFPRSSAEGVARLTCGDPGPPASASRRGRGGRRCGRPRCSDRPGARAPLVLEPSQPPRASAVREGDRMKARSAPRVLWI